MNNKVWRFTILFSLLLISATPLPFKKIRLTIINKSGLPMEYKLEGVGLDEEIDLFYYLRVPEGDRFSPIEETFTIYQGKYTMTAYYIELWDPVYGYSCGSSSKNLFAYRNIKLVFVECNQRDIPSGEPSMLKYSGRWRYIY